MTTKNTITATTLRSKIMLALIPSKHDWWRAKIFGSRQFRLVLTTKK